MNIEEELIVIKEMLNNLYNEVNLIKKKMNYEIPLEETIKSALALNNHAGYIFTLTDLQIIKQKIDFKEIEKRMINIANQEGYELYINHDLTTKTYTFEFAVPSTY